MLETLGTLEKTDLNIGFVPITCATPIIMAEPMGFYSRYGLNVSVIKTAGWAVARDKSLSGEYDASHMLTPMPLAMTLGAGSTAQPLVMPTIENINGQAIVLSNDHMDKRDPKTWKGLTFGVPFEYSMHNFLLRYCVAEHGLDPDSDIQIRVVPPPDMVANLRAGSLDGFLSPDPFNQRAVSEGIGFDQRDLGGPSLLRLCRPRQLRDRDAQHLWRPAAVHHRRHAICQRPRQPHGNRRRRRPPNYLNQPVPVTGRVGKTFDPADPVGYLSDYAIGRGA